MKIEIQLNFNKRFWLHRLLPFLKCRHFCVSVEEGFENRYGTRTLYKYCLKCGRKAMDIERNCRHELNGFGVCKLCLSRQAKFDCDHIWVQEPDTDDLFCDNCGEMRQKLTKEMVIKDENQAWLTHQRCHSCGKPKATDPLCDTCEECWKNG